MKAWVARTTLEQQRTHARSVESAIFQCLMNAYNDRSREEYWFAHAQMLEQKFKTDYGRPIYFYLDMEDRRIKDDED